MIRFFVVIYSLCWVSLSYSDPGRLSEDAKKSALYLASLSPKEMLNKIRQEKICIKILKSTRKTPKGFFGWGSVDAPTGKLEDFTKIHGLMGKTLCANEVAMAKDCLTIVLASDAPKTTLIHEYLHAHQIKADPAWCPVSKVAWETGKMSKEEHAGMLEREWEVHVWLWENKNKLNLSAEDKVEIASTLLDQAQKRSSYEPGSQKYIAQQKVASYLDSAIVEYKKALGIK